jgi:hypothetical protein
MHFLTIALILSAAAAEPHIYVENLSVSASSQTGGAYAVEMAIDGQPATRWASADKAPMPQWFELRFTEPVELDTLLLHIPADHLYAAWKDVEVSFSSGDPVMLALDAGDSRPVIRFEARPTQTVRVTIRSVHEARHYVGLFEIQAALDPDHQLDTLGAPPRPKQKDDIVVRGRTEHPCVNLRPADVDAARKRCEEFEWARARRDAILEAAEPWLRESDDYWLQFLPEPGAAYAYGFTGDPSTGARFGSAWSGASCTWDRPRQVRGTEGRWFPNEEYPDPGTGYVAEDGRIHYFVGIYNAWVTEQWTLKALPALSEAYLLTGDERYAERGTLLLDALASIYSESTSGSWDYPSTPPSGRLARPWYQVARTLVMYVDQFDFMYHSPAMDKPSLREGMTRRENIVNHMLLDGAYYCYEHSYQGALHNGHADYVRGALAAGCLLDIPTYIDNAVTSAFSIYTMLENNIDRDGRYHETALGYAIHARSLYLTFADPLYNLRNAEYPEGINLYDNQKMQSTLYLPELTVMLAGRMPNFGDTAPDFKHKLMPARPMSATDYGFLERLYARTTSAGQREAYGATLLWLAEGDLARLRGEQRDPWLLWHAAPEPEGSSELPPGVAARVTGSWVAGMKGMAMLRAGDQAALLRFGPSLNHGDPDDLGLLYYANGYELSYDIGYGLGSTHVHCGWASSTVSHALVTVDESNQFEQPGSGGSLLLFADLPGIKLVQATSEMSYVASEVTEYRRTLALMARGGYLVDLFRVAGGKTHDYSFGSIGTNLEPFGLDALEPREGSLAEGYDWGHSIGIDGDIHGYPNKPYWNPPPGNGYGFFFDVRTGTPPALWGGTWTIDGEEPTTLRMHVAGDPAQAIFASAPGLYPHMPLSSYVIARRQSSDGTPLESTFLSVYEPAVPGSSSPRLNSVKRLDEQAVEVVRADGAADVVLLGDGSLDTSCGSVVFRGDALHLEGRGKELALVETLGCAYLEIDGQILHEGPGAFEARVVDVDSPGRSITLDADVPEGLEGCVAVFSNPAWTRTTAYHVAGAEGARLLLHANTLALGIGRVTGILGKKSIASEITHEYTRTVKKGHSTRFFDGKRIVGAKGGETRVTATVPGTPLQVDVEDSAALTVGETFTYYDLGPGDTVRVAWPRVHLAPAG